MSTLDPNQPAQPAQPYHDPDAQYQPAQAQAAPQPAQVPSEPPPTKGAEIGGPPQGYRDPPYRAQAPMVNPPADPANAPQHTLVPLCGYTVFLLAPHFQAAQDFARACLDPQQPWSYIEGVDMLEHLGAINVFVFSDWAARKDATQVMQVLLLHGARLCYDPNQLDKMPPTQVEQAPIRGPIQGNYDEPAADTPPVTSPVNPMDIPPSA